LVLIVFMIILLASTREVVPRRELQVLAARSKWA
jgi:hypothetical protein